MVVPGADIRETEVPVRVGVLSRSTVAVAVEQRHFQVGEADLIGKNVGGVGGI